MAGGWAVEVSPFVLEKTYRFPVLAHWSFTATNDGDFRSIVQALDVGLLGTQYGTVLSADPNGADPTKKVEHVHLPDPDAPPRPNPPELAETGHMALPQTSRRGESATAWYRGPFGPLPTDRDPPDSPLAHVSDQLRTLTPDGREDVSLAAAFEIGRLLGLSQPALVAALVRWRSEQFGAARAHTIGDVVSQATPFTPDATRPGAELGRLIGMQLMTAAGQTPGTVTGPARPIADPGRPIELPGPLDQVVAAGLGLDLGRLQEQARVSGMVAALAGTDVVVSGGRRVDQAMLAGLRATLDGEVERVASAARPEPYRHRRRGRSGRCARRARRAHRHPRAGGHRPMIMTSFDAKVALDVQLQRRDRRHDRPDRDRSGRRRPRRSRRHPPSAGRAAAAEQRPVLLPGAGRARSCRRSRCASSTSTATGPTPWSRAC